MLSEFDRLTVFLPVMTLVSFFDQTPALIFASRARISV
ncbi:hypothetical protein COI_0221 [Mannheimia haemolytica serotype A2 str. OVINE]|nr:hypothetical protein COI_0221 [Mannheimia haemolytica serotype A2 str. OVINE]